MSFSSKAISGDLIKRLSSLSYASFQNYCREIIGEILPSTVASKEMRRLDSAGVDLFLLGDDSDSLEFAFQCKGLESPHFEKSQLKQCLHSIQSLSKLAFKCDSYFLIINRDVYKDEMEKLNAELQKIKDLGKIKQFKVLDSRGFINFLGKKITENFKIAIRKSNERLYQEYRDSLDQRFYYPDVPFELNEHRIAINPSAYLEKSLEVNKIAGKESELHYEPSKYFFVIGDFGFGKTSLMFQSVHRLVDYNTVYIPLSYFRKRDFQNGLEFTMVINKLVTGEEGDFSDLFFRFKSRVLLQLINNDPKLVLLFDGMDENIYLYSTEGLKLIFTHFIQVKAKCIFSMRKTFWEDMAGNFQEALPKRRTHKDRIKLLEWDNKQINEFLENYKSKHRMDEAAQKNISDFQEIVKINKYQHYYGDIPRRPLFLEMIAQDIADGKLKKTFLSELYETYFYKKFVWDSDSRFQNIPSGRPKSYTGDILKGFSTMVTIMENIAGRMYEQINETVFLEPDIEESQIENLIGEYNLPSLQAFLLNSAMTTMSSRSRTGIKLRFAHRSFQEYFLARFLCREIAAQNKGWDDLARLIFPDTVNSFAVNHLEWRQQEERILSKEVFRKFLQISWPQNSLGDILTVIIPRK